MKKLITILLLLFTGNLFAQYQRLSILPQGKLEINGMQSSVEAKSICIDYYRETPLYYNYLTYDQVYSSGETVVKINGQIVNKSFQELVQGENPLLILMPQSNLSVKIIINRDNKLGRQVKDFEIEFKSPSEIGNIKDDRNVSQAKIIFKNFGQDISQQEYWEKAKLLDVLAKNKKLEVSNDNQLSENSKKMLNNLSKTYYINLKDFKYFVDNDYLKIDDEGNLTKDSKSEIDQEYQYINALKDIHLSSDELNMIIDKPQENADELINLLYKSGSKALKDVEKLKYLRDTIINKSRYILCLAWKGDWFKGVYEKHADDNVGLSFFQSADTLFNKPFFVTIAGEMEEWCKEHNMSRLEEKDQRIRLKQLLGLPTRAGNDLFVEIWVKKEDLFRPTFYPDVNVSNEARKPDYNYLLSLMNYSAGSFKNSNYGKQYPFTSMGYTYDVNPETIFHIGLNEFVLKEKRTVYVRRDAKTGDYIKLITKTTDKQ